jgi:opacity protein-like surface antigen
MSAYFALGGGGSICVDQNGLSSCVEAGAGLGLSPFDIDPFSGTHPGGEYNFAEVGIGAGVAADASFEVPAGPCHTGDYTLSGKVGLDLGGGNSLYLVGGSVPHHGDPSLSGPSTSAGKEELPGGGKIGRKWCSAAPW